MIFFSFLFLFMNLTVDISSSSQKHCWSMCLCPITFATNHRLHSGKATAVVYQMATFLFIWYHILTSASIIHLFFFFPCSGRNSNSLILTHTPCLLWTEIQLGNNHSSYLLLVFPMSIAVSLNSFVYIWQGLTRDFFVVKFDMYFFLLKINDNLN